MSSACLYLLHFFSRSPKLPTRFTIPNVLVVIVDDHEGDNDEDRVRPIIRSNQRTNMGVTIATSCHAVGGGGVRDCLAALAHSPEGVGISLVSGI
jgi:hypothetical protein